MKISFLVSLLIIKVKTSESVQCYSFCLGSEEMCKNGSQVKNETSCAEDEICMAQKSVDGEIYKCIKSEEVQKCEKDNQLKNVCFTCKEDRCNTVEKLQTMAASRIQCYFYCTGTHCAKSMLPKKTSSGPCGLETKYCAGMKVNDGDYYSCVKKDFEEKCKKYNTTSAVCLFCEGNLCNKLEVVTKMEKSRLHCYHYCTGQMCPKNFGEHWDEEHTQVCSSSAVGCVGTKTGKEGGHLFTCVDHKNATRDICEDETDGDVCKYCETDLCNSPQNVTLRKLQCYSFCSHSYEEMNICKADNNAVAQKVICPENKKAGCMVVKQGNSEAYACASEEDKKKCSEMEEQGEGICFLCKNNMCNTQSAMNKKAKQYLPLGVSMCYFADGRNYQSQVTVKPCKFPYRINYKCESVVKEQANGSVRLWKNCTIHEDAEVRPECVSNVRNGKKLCYTCNQDLCNKSNFSEIDLGQKIKFDGSERFIHLPCWWYLCVIFFLLS